MTTNARRRWEKWSKDPRCHWCKRFTVPFPSGLPGEPYPDFMATLDHIHHRSSPNRGKDTSAVLSCWACNQKRGVRAKRKSEENQTPTYAAPRTPDNTPLSTFIVKPLKVKNCDAQSSETAAAIRNLGARKEKGEQ